MLRTLFRFAPRALVVLVASLFSSACFQYQARQQFAQTYGGSVPLTLANDTATPACYVRIAPAQEGSWGDDWLGPTEIVNPGMARTFFVAPGSNWNIQVESCAHGVLGVAHALVLTTGSRLMLSQLAVVRGAFAPWTGAAVAAPPTTTTVNATASITLGGNGTTGDDVVTLHDGTLLRGRVAELHPNESVTLVLLTGQPREVRWSDVATVAGPSFPQRAQ